MAHTSACRRGAVWPVERPCRSDVVNPRIASGTRVMRVAMCAQSSGVARGAPSKAPRMNEIGELKLESCLQGLPAAWPASMTSIRSVITAAAIRSAIVLRLGRVEVSER